MIITIFSGCRVLFSEAYKVDIKIYKVIMIRRLVCWKHRVLFSTNGVGFFISDLPEPNSRRGNGSDGLGVR